MTSTSTPARGPATGAGHPRALRRRRKHVGRTAAVSTTVGEAAWRRVDARAERARLALGTWMVLLAADVAAGRPVVSEAVLEDVGSARVRVARIGSALNVMAARENQGVEVEDGELRAALDSLAVRVGQARDAVRAAQEAFAGEWAGGAAPSPGVVGVGRRSKEAALRGRQIRVQMTTGERDLLVAAAGLEGLSVGAWLGQLLEDEAAVRPLHGEVWGAVSALRRALRRVGTNLAQIEEARARRQVPAPAMVGVARGQIDAAIRDCLDAQATISGQGRAGVAA